MPKWTRGMPVENHPAVRMAGNKAFIDSCDRCGGEGYILAYRHVMGGICFRCAGKGTVAFDRSTITERTDAYIRKAGITGDEAQRLYDQARARFYKWVTEKQEREAQEFAKELWAAGNHVGNLPKETIRDSWFTCRVRELLAALWMEKGSPKSRAA